MKKIALGIALVVGLATMGCAGSSESEEPTPAGAQPEAERTGTVQQAATADSDFCHPRKTSPGGTVIYGCVNDVTGECYTKATIDGKTYTWPDC